MDTDEARALRAVAESGGQGVAQHHSPHPPLFRDMVPRRETSMLLPHACSVRVVALTKGGLDNPPGKLTPAESLEFSKLVEKRRCMALRATNLELGSPATWFPHRQARLAFVYVYDWSLDYHNSDFNGFQAWQYGTTVKVEEVGECCTIPSDDIWFACQGLERFRQRLWEKNIQLRASTIDKMCLWVVTGDNSQTEAALGQGVQMYVLTPHYGSRGKKEARSMWGH